MLDFVYNLKYNTSMRRIDWDKKELEELYWEQGLSLSKIGELKGVSLQAVYKAMVGFGIKRRGWSREENYRWKGGRVKTGMGYVRVKDRNHLRADCNGYVLEHIVRWEEANGSLPSGFVIHHLNGIKDDNRPVNLVALSKGRHRPDLVLKEIQKRLRQVESELAQQRMTLG